VASAELQLPPVASEEEEEETLSARRRTGKTFQPSKYGPQIPSYLMIKESSELPTQSHFVPVFRRAKNPHDRQDRTRQLALMAKASKANEQFSEQEFSDSVMSIVYQ